MFEWAPGSTKIVFIEMCFSYLPENSRIVSEQVKPVLHCFPDSPYLTGSLGSKQQLSRISLAFCGVFFLMIYSCLPAGAP